MVFAVFLVDSPSGYNLGEINDIVQSTQQEPECAQIMNMYYKKTTQDRVLWQPFWIFSGNVWFCCCCLFVVVVVVVVVVAVAAAAADVVVSSCLNICGTFIHLVENQYLQTLRNIGNLQTQF